MTRPSTTSPSAACGKCSAALADDTPLHLGVVDHQHFNTLLGTMPITSARMMAHYGGATLILHVPTS